MSQVEFARLHTEILRKLEETRQLLRDQGATGDLIEKISEASALLKSAAAALRIAVVGEFSAGKSTILKALTGEELETGIGVVTTESKEIPWQGLVLVDTPGVKSSKDVNKHDEISEDETRKADLVLFVVTNELPEPNVEFHYRKLILDSLPDGMTGYGLHAKTAVIVNKMNRVKRRPPEKFEERCNNILKHMIKISEPHTEIPIFLCDAERYLYELSTGNIDETDNKAVAQFETLIENINTFSRERGLFGRLQTPVQAAVDALELAISASDSGAVKAKAQDLDKILKIISKARRDYYREITEKGQAELYAELRKEGNQIIEAANFDQLDSDQGLQIIIDQIEDSFSNTTDDVFLNRRRKTEAFLVAVQEELRDFSLDDEIVRELQELNLKESGQRAIDITGAKMQLAGYTKPFFTHAMRALKEAAEDVAKDPKMVKGLIKAIAKGKYKFKPWGLKKAVGHVTKGASKVAKAVPFLAAAGEAILNYREEKEKESKERFKAEARGKLRSYVREKGTERRQTFAECFADVYESTIGTVDENLRRALDELRLKQDTANKGLQVIIDAKRQLLDLRSSVAGHAKKHIEAADEAVMEESG